MMSEVLLDVINFLLIVIGVISVLMIVIGGIRYTVSGGDQGAITEAKNTILYAVLGLIVGLLTFLLVNFVMAQFSATWETARPDTASPFTWDVTPVITVAGSVSLLAFASIVLRRKSRALRWLARFSAFWVHPEDRAHHREDMWFALYHAPLLLRARLAWELMMLSPISGRRSRNHRAQLAAAVAAESIAPESRKHARSH